MVLKRSVKRKRRNRRRRRSLQKGAGYSFNLDCNLSGGVSEVVTYKNCRTPQADLAPPADSQLAPLGQAQVEVVGVSNNNLAPVQQAQARVHYQRAWMRPHPSRSCTETTTSTPAPPRAQRRRCSAQLLTPPTGCGVSLCPS